MTAQDLGAKGVGAQAIGERRRKRLQEIAAADPREALEDMLLSAHRVAVALGELGIFQTGELTLAEWALLKSLGGRTDVPLREIGQASGVSRQRIRKLVSELETNGLVSTKQSRSADKRVRMISATPLAAKVLSLVSGQMQDLLPASRKAGRARPLVGAARSLGRVAKAMRRKTLGERPKGNKRRAGSEANLAGDD